MIGSTLSWIGPCFAYFPLHIEMPLLVRTSDSIWSYAFPFYSYSSSFLLWPARRLILLVGTCFTPGASPYCLTLVFVRGRVVRCRCGWFALKKIKKNFDFLWVYARDRYSFEVIFEGGVSSGGWVIFYVGVIFGCGAIYGGWVIFGGGLIFDDEGGDGGGLNFDI